MNSASLLSNPVFIVLLALALSRAGTAVVTLIRRDPAPALDGKAYAFPGFDPIAKQTAILETAWAAVLPLAAAAVDLRHKAEALLAWNRAILLSAAVAAIVLSALAGAYRRQQSLGLASGTIIPATTPSGHNYVFLGSGVADQWLYSTNRRLGSFVIGTVTGTFAALVLAAWSGPSFYAFVLILTIIAIAVAATTLGSAIHNVFQRDRERILGGHPPAS